MVSGHGGPLAMKKNQSPKKKRRVPKAILRLPDLDQLRASPLLQQNGRAPQSGIGGGHGCDAGAGNRNSHGAWRERPSERKCRLAGASALTFLMPRDRPVENVAGLRVGTGVEILRYRPFWGGPRLARLKSYAQT